MAGVAEMAAPERPPGSTDPWTFDDLLSLPESLWRYEIVDGGLLMTPPAGVWHEAVSVRLRDVIGPAVGADHVALGPVAIDIHPTYLIPDLLVVQKHAVRPERNRTWPADLLLVVEVVSPGSQSSDRILKPAKYAAAGIPYYWRVETRPRVSLTACALRPGATAYTEVGTWRVGKTASFAEPFVVDIPIAGLEPNDTR